VAEAAVLGVPVSAPVAVLKLIPGGVGVIEKVVAGADKLVIVKPVAEVLMVTVSEECVSVKAGMFPKALAPIVVTELGIVMEVSPVLEKAAAPIVVTELGISTAVSEILPSKAALPIVITESGIATAVSEVLA
jgi:hypothetical protein